MYIKNMKLALLLQSIILVILMTEQTFKYVKFTSHRKIPDILTEPKHFALLNNEDLKPLPDQFSICSSLLIEYFRNYPLFIYLITKNDSFWFSIFVAQDLKAERYYLWLTSNSGNVLAEEETLRLNPWAWSHMCVGVDLTRGNVYLMMNKVMMSNITLDDPEFRQSKPIDLHTKVQVGDWYLPGWEVFQSKTQLATYMYIQEF